MAEGLTQIRLGGFDSSGCEPRVGRATKKRSSERATSWLKALNYTAQGNALCFMGYTLLISPEGAELNEVLPFQGVFGM